MSSKKFKKISVIIDNKSSWIWNYFDQIESKLKQYASQVTIYRNSTEIMEGDILFILSCDRILSSEYLAKHRHNIVIHESDLPKGKGWAPLSWQVESGQNEIPITLFEAEENLDSGYWYLKDVIRLEGHELIDEIRQKQLSKTLFLINEFLIRYPLKGNQQTGTESFYPKRTEENQKIDIDRSIADQFNKLRVCDNDRYPGHFSFKGHKYIIKIFKA